MDGQDEAIQKISELGSTIERAEANDPADAVARVLSKRPHLAFLKSHLTNNNDDKIAVNQLFAGGRARKDTQSIVDDWRKFEKARIMPRIEAKAAEAAEVIGGPLIGGDSAYWPTEQEAGQMLPVNPNTPAGARAMRGRMEPLDSAPLPGAAPVATPAQMGQQTQSVAPETFMSRLQSGGITDFGQLAEQYALVDTSEQNAILEAWQNYLSGRPAVPNTATRKDPNVYQLILSNILAAVGGDAAQVSQVLAYPFQRAEQLRLEEQARYNQEFESSLAQMRNAGDMFEAAFTEAGRRAQAEASNRVQGLETTRRLAGDVLSAETSRLNNERTAAARVYTTEQNNRARQAVAQIQAESRQNVALVNSPEQRMARLYALLVNLGETPESALAIVKAPHVQEQLTNALIQARTATEQKQLDLINSQIDLNAARGEAAMLNAQRPVSSGGISGTMTFNAGRDAIKNEVDMAESAVRDASSALERAQKAFDEIDKQVKEERDALGRLDPGQIQPAAIQQLHLLQGQREQARATLQSAKNALSKAQADRTAASTRLTEYLRSGGAASNSGSFRGPVSSRSGLRSYNPVQSINQAGVTNGKFLLGGRFPINLDKPYVWGGCPYNDRGTDCGGFVGYAIREGVNGDPNFPKIGTSQQEAYIKRNLGRGWERVERGQYQIGDIIYTRSGASRSGRHVVMVAGKDAQGRWVYANAAGRQTGANTTSKLTGPILGAYRFVGR